MAEVGMVVEAVQSGAGRVCGLSCERVGLVRGQTASLLNAGALWERFTRGYMAVRPR